MHMLPPLFFPGPMCALYSRSWGPRKSTSAHAGIGTTNPSVAKRRKLSITFHSALAGFLPMEVRGHRETAPVVLNENVGHAGDGLHLVRCCRVCPVKVNEAEAFEAVLYSSY